MSGNAAPQPVESAPPAAAPRASVTDPGRVPGADLIPIGMRARIAAHYWAGTPLGPMSAWPAHLSATVDLMVAHGFPMIVLWGQQLIQLYNDGYAEVMADKHPGGLGLPTATCWPEVWHINGPIYDRVWQGETITYQDKPYPLARNGRLEDAWFTITYSPLHAPSGRIEGVLVTMFETTAEHLARQAREKAEQERRRSDERLALAFKVLPVGIAVIDPAGEVVMCNDVMATYLPTARVPSSDPANVERWTGWDPQGRPLAPRDFAVARALRGETVTPGLEFLFRHDDGRQAWTQVAAAPLRDEAGRLDGVFAVVVDIDAIKRSTESLRENEERFRQFASASSDVLWIRDARTLDTELLSAAFDGIYGRDRDACIGPIRHWSSTVVADDRDAAMQTLRDVRDGSRRVHEFRIQNGVDGSYRHMRDTVFPLFDADGKVQRIAGICSDVTEERQQARHQTVLLAELQHRVRNIMAMIASMTWRSRERATSVDDYARTLTGRVMSLARTQALLTRSANAGVGLRQLLDEELSVQVDSAQQYRLQGDEVLLSPKAAEVLALALHELAANALKHGALRTSAGRVDVSWQVAPQEGRPWLRLTWQEQLPEGLTDREAPTPHRRGFGHALIEERVPYELGGTGRIALTAQGAQALISLPLDVGQSILQTDAPATGPVDGGSGDLSAALDLSGCEVLVLEDDYHLAHDTAGALRSAGAGVVGPLGSAEEALARLARGGVDGAVVDVNLGPGARFDVIRTLQASGRPFVVVTGYDAGVLPPDLRDIARLQKPVAAAAVVRALHGQGLGRMLADAQAAPGSGQQAAARG